MSKSSHYKITSILTICFLLIVSLYMVYHRVGFSPDQFFAVGIIAALIIGRFKQFVQDWFFPTAWFLSYEYLRGIIPIVSSKAHIHLMINFDQTVFGFVPTLALQHQLYTDGVIHWYDYLATILYMSHFIVPEVIGFIFWIYKRKLFANYFLSLLILSYMGFITFLAFPAMPPWLASKNGYLSEVAQIMQPVFKSFGNSVNLPSVYQFFGANLVAAVPSLHAAYPFLTFLYLYKSLKRRSLWVLGYVLAVWFSIVYLGEHYVFDILIGVIYATVAFLVVEKRYYISIIFEKCKGGDNS